MKRIGIVGGIGSGKSYICDKFSKMFGIHIYYSDLSAKSLMNTNLELKNEIKNYFGLDSYINDQLNKQKFIDLLFTDELSKLKMDSIIHPYIEKDFDEWCNNYKDENYVLFESAILFDINEKIKTDLNILVVSDLDIRIERIQKRNNISIDEIMNRINSQSTDDFKMNFSDFIIKNNDEINTIKQIIDVHKKLEK